MPAAVLPVMLTGDVQPLPAQGGAEGARVSRTQDSEDIRYMVGALKALGVELEERWEQAEMVVHGCAGRFPAQGADLFLGNAGTAMR